MGKVSFGRKDSGKIIDMTKVISNPISLPVEATKEERIHIEYVEVPTEIIVEKELIKEVPIETIKTEVRTIEVIKEVIKEVEVPVVVREIEIVEIEKPVEKIVEKIVKIYDTAALIEERRNNEKLRKKNKLLSIALACVIVISIIMVVA